MELSNMVSILKQMFKSLSADEQQSFLDSLKNEPKDIKGFESLKQAVIKRNPNPLPDRCNCPHCQSTDVVKNGNRRGVQRFMCKECKRTITATRVDDNYCPFFMPRGNYFFAARFINEC